MTRQLPLGISLRESASLASFYPGDNEQALAAVEDCASARGEPLVYLWGASATGKSHLLQGACRHASERSMAVAYLPLVEAARLSPAILQDLDAVQLLCLDDVHCIAGQAAWEQGLFHLFNQLRDSGARLLVSATRSPRLLPLQLADLRSRLGWGLSFHLQPLSDMQKAEALTGHAERRGLTLPAETARYIINHTGRDMGSLLHTLDRLDQASLAAQRRLTVPFVKEMLQQFGSG